MSKPMTEYLTEKYADETNVKKKNYEMMRELLNITVKLTLQVAKLEAKVDATLEHMVHKESRGAGWSILGYGDD